MFNTCQMNLLMDIYKATLTSYDHQRIDQYLQRADRMPVSALGAGDRDADQHNDTPVPTQEHPPVPA